MSCDASSYPPSKTALLLLDYHNLVVDRIGSVEERAKVVSTAQKLLQAARENKASVAHCLIGLDEPPRETSKYHAKYEGYFKPMRQNERLKTEEITEIAGPETETETEITVTKVLGCISALKTEKLLNFLKDKGVVSLVIAGLSTSGATLSTAREAADLGFVTTVVRDGCWDPEQDVHAVVLDKIIPMTCEVVSVDDGVKLLGRK